MTYSLVYVEDPIFHYSKNLYYGHTTTFYFDGSTFDGINKLETVALKFYVKNYSDSESVQYIMTLKFMHYLFDILFMVNIIFDIFIHVMLMGDLSILLLEKCDWKYKF